MISFALEEEQELVRDTARRFASEVVRPRLRDWERAGEVPADARRKMHDTGVAQVEVMDALGAGGGQLMTALIAHEALAFGDPGAAVALWAPHLVPAALVELGDDEQARRVLARFAEPDGAQRLGAVAWSELEGPPLEGFATTAEKVPGGYRLRGEKAFVVNGGRADVTIVFAQVEPGRGWEGAGAFVVEGDAANGIAGLLPGPRHELLGLETAYVGRLVLDGVTVPEDNRLWGLSGAPFSESLRRFFARASLVAAARQVGLANAAFSLALDYTQERRAFGKAVAHFQAIAFALAEMAMDVESARWMTWRAAVEVERGEWDARRVADAAVAANEAAFRVADNAVQLLGGAGFIRDFPVEKWLRDTKTLALTAPGDQLQQLVSASAALGHAAGELLPGSAIQPIVT